MNKPDQYNQRMSKASVRKGKDGERELSSLIRRELQDKFGIIVDIQRKIEQTRDGGFDLEGIPFMAIEVKRCEKLCIESWWKQTLRQASDARRLPVLAYRQSRKQWRFMLPFAAFAEDIFIRAYGGEVDFYASDRRMELDLDSFILLCYDNILAGKEMIERKKQVSERGLH